jgi:ubiquinone/menaquinone biosynthesis C-methylase UbiE
MSAPKIFTPEYYARMRELEAGSWWNAAMRDIAGQLLRDVRLPAGGTVLDVGCGSGQTLAWFSRMFGAWRTVGCDISTDAVNAAARLGFEISRASALSLPYPDASADVVICLDVLQHVPLDGGDLTALREMRRVLRPGGWLFVRTNAQSFPASADDPEFQFHRYEPDELRGKLATAGFVVRRLSRVNALLGLAEIPRELRARRVQTAEYHGILATPNGHGSWVSAAKRAWLRVEGQAVRHGVRLPAGRTIVALATTPGGS